MKYITAKMMLLAWLLINQPANAQITGVFFLPEDHSQSSYHTKDFIPTNGCLSASFFEHASADYLKQLTNAISAGECRLAEADSEGHWGEERLGFQLSIRSATNVFVRGESIPIKTIFRNTTTNLGAIMWASWRLTSLKVQDREGKNISYTPEVSKREMGGSAGMGQILPKRQFGEDFDLKDHLASAKAGYYRIQANRMVIKIELATNSVSWELAPNTNEIHLPTLNGEQTNLQSGVITIKLVDP